MNARQKNVAIVVVLALALVACASVAPGNDPVIVNAERGLAAADVIYAESMRYYFSPGVGATLSKPAVTIFEAVRTGFDPVYKAVQGALDTYKLVKTAEANAKLIAKQQEMATLLNPAASITPSKPKPIEVP